MEMVIVQCRIDGSPSTSPAYRLKARFSASEAQAETPLTKPHAELLGAAAALYSLNLLEESKNRESRSHPIATDQVLQTKITKW